MSVEIGFTNKTWTPKGSNYVHTSSANENNAHCHVAYSPFFFVQPLWR